MEPLEVRVSVEGVPNAPWRLPTIAPTQTMGRNRTQTKQERRELIVVDAAVESQKNFVSSILSSSRRGAFEILNLNDRSSGVDQITEALKKSTSSYRAIHIIAHGQDGGIRLGSNWLTAESLPESAGEIASWSNALTSTANLMFYGCDLASDDDGTALVELISHLTGAEVAAADEPTGSDQSD